MSTVALLLYSYIPYAYQTIREMIRHVTGPTRTRTKSKKTSSLVCAVGVCLAFMLAAVVFLFVDPTAGSSSGDMPHLCLFI